MTALEGLSQFIKSTEGPVTIVATDNFVEFREHVNLKDLKFDLLVWTASQYPPASVMPTNYTWIKSDDSGRVSQVSIKNLPSGVLGFRPFIGTITFRNFEYAFQILNQTLEAPNCTDTELHIENILSTAICNGNVVKELQVDYFLSVGTEDEVNLARYLEEHYPKG